jgi:hypothetical protein
MRADDFLYDRPYSPVCIYVHLQRRTWQVPLKASQIATRKHGFTSHKAIFITSVVIFWKCVTSKSKFLYDLYKCIFSLVNFLLILLLSAFYKTTEMNFGETSKTKILLIVHRHWQGIKGIFMGINSNICTANVWFYYDRYRHSVVVKTLCYKPESRGFEAWWGEWIYSMYLILPTSLGPKVYSASNRNEYQKHKTINVSGG